MKHSILRVLAAVAVIFTLAFNSNPPNGRTGAPGDGICTDCHGGGAHSGNISLTGVPATVSPGQTYTLTVMSTTASNSVFGGFQMVGLHVPTEDNAGSMSNPSPASAVTLVPGTGRIYHEHQPAASFNGMPSVNWTVDWTAPTTGPTGDITFWVAGILANGNGNPSGDGLVTTTATGAFTGVSPLAATISMSSPVSCFGLSDGAATVTAAGGTSPYTYNWSSGETDSTATMLSAGNQSVTVTDDNSMTAIAMVTIMEPGAISAGISVDNDITCFGANDGQATSDPTGGTGPFDFSWDNGNLGATATGLTPGIHSVTITDANGCTAFGETSISEPTVLTIDLISQTQITCAGFNDGTATVSAMGGTPNYSFGWSNGQMGPTATNLIPGLVTATVTDANGCMVSLDVITIEPSPVELMLVNQGNVSCNGGDDGSATVMASGGSGPYDYMWSDGQVTATATNLVANTYTCTVMDANDCMNIISVNISEPMPISIILDITHESGPGAGDGSITANTTGGTAPFSFTWSNSQTGPTITNLSPGPYTVTVLDANDCILTATGIVNGTGCALTVNIEVVQDISCPGSVDGILTFTASDPVTDIVWSTTETADTIYNVAAGTITVLVTDSSGCEAMATGDLMDLDTEMPFYELDTLCLFLGPDGTAVLDSATFYENLLDNCDPNPTAIFTSITVECSSAGYISVDFTVNDASGNIGPQTLYLLVVDTLRPTIICPADITSSTCDTITYALPTATDNCGMSSIELLSGIGSGQIFPVGTTTETYIATDSSGNQSLCSFNVTVISDLGLSISTTDATCFDSQDGSALILGSGGTAPYTFVISPQSDVTMLGQGVYGVTMRDEGNCVISDTFEIGGPDAITLDDITITHATAGSFDGSIEIDVSGGTSPYEFLWRRDTSLYSVEEDLFNLFAGNYFLVVTDANDCQIAFDTIEVEEILSNQIVNDFDAYYTVYSYNKQLYIQPKNITGRYALQLFDVSGKQLVEQSNNTGEQQINLNQYPSELFIIRLVDDEHGAFSKAIIGN